MQTVIVQFFFIVQKFFLIRVFFNIDMYCIRNAVKDQISSRVLFYGVKTLIVI